MADRLPTLEEISNTIYHQRSAECNGMIVENSPSTRRSFGSPLLNRRRTERLERKKSLSKASQNVEPLFMEMYTAGNTNYISTTPLTKIDKENRTVINSNQEDEQDQYDEGEHLMKSSQIKFSPLPQGVLYNGSLTPSKNLASPSPVHTKTHNVAQERNHASEEKWNTKAMKSPSMRTPTSKITSKSRSIQAMEDTITPTIGRKSTNATTTTTATTATTATATATVEALTKEEAATTSTAVSSLLPSTGDTGSNTSDLTARTPTSSSKRRRRTGFLLSPNPKLALSPPPPEIFQQPYYFGTPECQNANNICLSPFGISHDNPIGKNPEKAIADDSLSSLSLGSNGMSSAKGNDIQYDAPPSHDSALCKSLEDRFNELSKDFTSLKKPVPATTQSSSNRVVNSVDNNNSNKGIPSARLSTPLKKKQRYSNLQSLMKDTDEDTQDHLTSIPKVKSDFLQSSNNQDIKQNQESNDNMMITTDEGHPNSDSNISINNLNIQRQENENFVNSSAHSSAPLKSIKTEHWRQEDEDDAFDDRIKMIEQQRSNKRQDMVKSYVKAKSEDILADSDKLRRRKPNGNRATPQLSKRTSNVSCNSTDSLPRNTAFKARPAPNFKRIHKKLNINATKSNAPNNTSGPVKRSVTGALMPSSLSRENNTIKASNVSQPSTAIPKKSSSISKIPRPSVLLPPSYTGASSSTKNGSNQKIKSAPGIAKKVPVVSKGSNYQISHGNLKKSSQGPNYL